MYPVLFRLFDIPIYAYGLLVAMGFLVGIMVVRHEANRLGEPSDKLMDLSFYSILAAIIGSRIFYVFADPKPFLEDPVELFRLWNGGLVFYGGLIGVFITGVIYIRVHKLHFLKILDIASPAVAIGHGIGRIGCFCAGCCYGRACSLPWAVTFTNEKALAPLHIPLHPTQLYESLSNFMLFIIIFNLRKRMKFDGQLFCIYMILYAGVRMVNETFRGDFRGSFGIGILSPSQSIGLVMIVLFSGLYIFLSKRSKKGEVEKCRKSD